MGVVVLRGLGLIVYSEGIRFSDIFRTQYEERSYDDVFESKMFP